MFTDLVMGFAECHAALRNNLTDILKTKEKAIISYNNSLQNKEVQPVVTYSYKRIFALTIIIIAATNVVILTFYFRKSSQKAQIISRRNFVGTSTIEKEVKFDEKDKQFDHNLPIAIPPLPMKPKQNMLTPEAIFKYSKDYKLTVELIDKDTATLTLRAIYKNENKDELLNFCAKNGIPLQEPKQNQIEELYPQLKTYKINNEEFYGNFEDHKNIGNGAFSSVYKAMSKLDKRIYAIKVIRVYAKYLDTASESREISIDEKELNEFRLLASLDYHQNIVRRYYNWITNGWILPKDQIIGEADESISISESVAVPTNSEKLTICIVMDYYDNTLHDYILKRKQINKTESFNIFEGMIKGIEYLHQNQIMHRDIKPQNVFLKTNQAVIGDFGLSRKVLGDSVYNSCKSRSSSTSSSDEFTNGIGSYRYISPEQLSTKEYNEKTDLFPCGLILIELFYIFTTGFEQSNVFDRIRKGEVLSNDIKNEIGEELSLMVSWLTKLDYHDRISASDLLKSDVFKMAKAKFSM